jgi:hypothetical protein
MYKTDKIRAHREALKHAWFNMDHSNTPVRKEITVEMDKYPGRKGQGIVKILDEGPGSYSCFTTHQENPFLYLSEREEFLSGKYELIIIK